MARKLRVEYAGAVYHVMNRGDRREAVFLDVEDRQRFLATLGEACVKTGWQALSYDADGNLSADGIWTYQWDAENRLISMAMTGTVANLAATNRLRLDFAYDYKDGGPIPTPTP